MYESLWQFLFAGNLGTAPMLHPLHNNSLFCSRKLHKITKTPYFWASRSFNIINVDTIKKHMLVMISNTSMPNCNRFHNGQAKREK